MYERDKDTRSHVKTFRHGDMIYEHSIFIADDDRVECVDRKGTVIVTYTADCKAYVGSKNDKNKKLFGRFNMNAQHLWTFTPEGIDGKDQEEIELNVRDVLRGEVEITRMYLDGKFPIKPEAKEGAA